MLVTKVGLQLLMQADAETNFEISVTDLTVAPENLGLGEWDRAIDGSFLVSQSRGGSLATNLPQHKFATILQKWRATATSLPHISCHYH